MSGNARELQGEFWSAMDKDRTVMLACEGVYPRPMTALAENARGPIWFFTSNENDLAQAVTRNARPGLLMLASKGHDLFATAGGTLSMDNDPAVIDRLWNPFVAAWYEGGRTRNFGCCGSTRMPRRSGATTAACWPASR